jgi:hypothetical protein
MSPHEVNRCRPAERTRCDCTQRKQHSAPSRTDIGPIARFVSSATMRSLRCSSAVTVTTFDMAACDSRTGPLRSGSRRSPLQVRAYTGEMPERNEGTEQGRSGGAERQPRDTVILLAEDEALVRNLIQLMLVKEGYAVLAASARF